MARKMIIAGNWKMNKTAAQAAEFVKELIPEVKGTKNEIVVGVPFVCIPDVAKALKKSKIKIAAQNVHFEKNGAFTGEVSAEMLKELGVEYVIIGHSERRQYFAETDDTVNLKAHTVFANDMKPIICVGESLKQREDGITDEWIRAQVKLALRGLSEEQVKKLVIAYEPIWAIGTGKTATKEQAQEVCAMIRNCVKELYGRVTANAVRIQYGGSVNAKNSKELFDMSDIDGGLVGGASLKTADFAVIANYQQ